MIILSKLLTGAAGLAMVAGVAAPAAAQGYPYGGYGNQGGGVVGQVIQQVLGGGAYGQYGQGNDRVAVDQCARAAEARVSRDFRTSGYGAYGQGYGNQGYNQQAADLRFSCRVDYRGYVRDIDIKRNNQAYRRGY